eukprot:260417-Rhodomonas_salina.1
MRFDAVFPLPVSDRETCRSLRRSGGRPACQKKLQSPHISPSRVAGPVHRVLIQCTKKTTYNTAPVQQESKTGTLAFSPALQSSNGGERLALPCWIAAPRPQHDAPAEANHRAGFGVFATERVSTCAEKASADSRMILCAFVSMLASVSRLTRTIGWSGNRE